MLLVFHARANSLACSAPPGLDGSKSSIRIARVGPAATVAKKRLRLDRASSRRRSDTFMRAGSSVYRVHKESTDRASLWVRRSYGSGAICRATVAGNERELAVLGARSLFDLSTPGGAKVLGPNERATRCCRHTWLLLAGGWIVLHIKIRQFRIAWPRKARYRVRCPRLANCVAGDVVDAVGHRAAEFWDGKNRARELPRPSTAIRAQRS
jgi:hypothetical protein